MPFLNSFIIKGLHVYFLRNNFPRIVRRAKAFSAPGRNLLRFGENIA
jgi:hypothetical protein